MCPKSRVGVDNPWWTISVENWSIIWCPNGSSSHQIITSPPDGWPHIVMCDGAAGANANNHVMYHTQKYLKACSAHLFSENQSQKTSMFYRVGFPLTGFDPQERNFGLVLSHSCKWEIYVPVTFWSSLTPWRLDCCRWPEGPPCMLDCCRWPEGPPWRLDCCRWPEGPPCMLDCCRWPEGPPWRLDGSRWPEGPPWRLDCSRWPEGPPCMLDGSRWPEGPPWRLDCCRWPGLFGRTMFDPSSVLESVAVPPFSYGQVPLRGAED